MFNLTKLKAVLEEIAPLELSKKMIEQGGYDNSGIIVNSHEHVGGVLFALDLTEQVVAKAKRLKCDTIVTHHPAIYRPISSLGVDDVVSAPVLRAVENKINVISMHLNLDVADFGIDHYLAQGLGAKSSRILSLIDGVHGYGREFVIDNIRLDGFVANVKRTFGTKKVIYYGNKNAVIDKVASFCGAGADNALSAVKSGQTDAQVIVTSDLPHHVISNLVCLGKSVVILTHFASENYGFKKFYESVSEKIGSLAYTCFFEDKRLF